MSFISPTQDLHRHAIIRTDKQLMVVAIPTPLSKLARISHINAVFQPHIPQLIGLVTDNTIRLISIISVVSVGALIILAELRDAEPPRHGLSCFRVLENRLALSHRFRVVRGAERHGAILSHFRAIGECVNVCFGNCRHDNGK